MEDKKLFNLGQFIMYMIIIVLVMMSNIAFGQSDVPTNNFEEKINIKEAFGDDNNKPVIVEFWAKFNEANCFAEWDKYKDGFKEEVFKAGLDLTLPADLSDIQEAINEVNNASKF